MNEYSFKPAWWLSNSHLQTLWPTLCRRPIKDLFLRRERFELPDGDFIDLDWVGRGEGPIVILLHGLEGSIESPYAKGMLAAIQDQGWRGVAMHFRGCSGEQNRLPRTYHSGDTADLNEVVHTLLKRESVPMAAIGFSLGGNVLLKWLGESKQDNPLTTAVAVSVPFELHKAVKRMSQGFSRVYQWHLLTCLRQKIKNKFAMQPSPIALPNLNSLHSIEEFDDKVTAPMHGFQGVRDYYAYASSRQYLRDIHIPTLLIHAKDDPFMTEDLIPMEHELSPSVKLELTEKGGHVGFVSGATPWNVHYWLEERIPFYLRHYLTT